MEQQCLECCTEAIREATFSEQYPIYCLKEVWPQAHPYVQGTLLRCNSTERIVSMVLSNGMDVYGNLRPTLTQLKGGINRGIIERKHQTSFMAACAKPTDIFDFVHITLSAKHKDYQRRGLARMLMVIDLLKWSLRGRTRAYPNGTGEEGAGRRTRLECVASPYSRRLYESFGFRDVYPRFDRDTDEQRGHRRSVYGRVMAHLNFVPDLMRIAERYDTHSEQSVAAANSSDGSTAQTAANGGSADSSCQRVHASPAKRLSLTGRKW
ncbi:hypothetical protein ERJ75_001709700 [Trypanosoma vivax]|nr:hypothetical protein ERJ75_001709700 [Trypanosoma vivax]